MVGRCCQRRETTRELSTLLALPDGLRLLGVTLLSATVVVAVCSCRVTSPCPCCNSASDRVHSSYTRMVADVPCAGRPVSVMLRVRKLRCPDNACAQQLFTERVPDYLRPWARKTMRLVEHMTSLGLATGGRGTETVGPALGRQVSDQTVLRRLVTSPEPDVEAGTVLGVDDCAFRRGRSDGTLLVNLAAHRVIDLLPDRSQLTFARWLQQQPAGRLISRDRGGAYAAGATLGARAAEHIADRFHLLQHAGEVLERCLTRPSALLSRAAPAIVPTAAVPRATKHTPAEVRRQQARRAPRHGQYERVVARHQQGVSAVQSAQQTGRARGTVLQ